MQNHQLQQIPKEEKEQLNQEISEQEIEKAIRRMKIGKAPGPHGISAKYYKTK